MPFNLGLDPKLFSSNTAFSSLWSDAGFREAPKHPAAAPVLRWLRRSSTRWRGREPFLLRKEASVVLRRSDRHSERSEESGQ